MTVLIVGADKLGKLPQELEQHGCQEVIHWAGRKKTSVKKEIPINVDFVVILHDYVSHRLMNSIKGQAKRLRLPVVFSKRSVADIKGKFISRI